MGTNPTPVKRAYLMSTPVGDVKGARVQRIKRLVFSRYIERKRLLFPGATRPQCKARINSYVRAFD